MTAAARANTPTDSGETAAKWSQVRVRETRDGAESGAENPSHKARWLEWGTRPHPIRPRSAESIATPEGQRAEADHPGTRAYHPLARAMAEVEASFPAIAESTLRDWADDIEGRAAKHRGITKT